MDKIPPKCPQCGRTKAWKEEVNAFKSGIWCGPFWGRVRFCAPRGLFAEPIKRKMGYYKVTYRCHHCGFRKEYSTGE